MTYRDPSHGLQAQIDELQRQNDSLTRRLDRRCRVRQRLWGQEFKNFCLGLFVLGVAALCSWAVYLKATEVEPQPVIYQDCQAYFYEVETELRRTLLMVDWWITESRREQARRER